MRTLTCGAVAAVLSAAAWAVPGPGDEESRGRTADDAIANIGAGRDVAEARRVLEELDDRALALRKLGEALEGDSFGVRGKYGLIVTLHMLGDTRAEHQALDSRSITTRRAACIQLSGDPEERARCAQVALAWLRDEAADDRWNAALICKHLDLKEAQPVLLVIVQGDPRTQDDLRLFEHALRALRNPKPPTLVERLFAMSADEELVESVRGIALEALQEGREPRERILSLSIGILSDPKANRILRIKAALGLREFPEDRVWQALETVLVSDREKDSILQRNCLFSLGQMAPKDSDLARRYLDRLQQLLHDRRVYHHKYFAIRVDVATALAALNARQPITFDILCDYLVDEDKDDRQHLVRQEAWLTLWTLTGTRFEDVPEPELWQIPPPPFRDPQAAREFLFRRAHLRPGISPAQSAMVGKLAEDLARMQKARQVYESLKDGILELWRAEAQEAAERKKEAEAKQEEAAAKEED